MADAEVMEGTMTWAWLSGLRHLYALFTEQIGIYRWMTAALDVGGYESEWMEKRERYFAIIEKMVALTPLLAAAKASSERAWADGREKRPQLECLRMQSREEQLMAALADAHALFYVRLDEKEKLR